MYLLEEGCSMYQDYFCSNSSPTASSPVVVLTQLDLMVKAFCTWSQIFISILVCYHRANTRLGANVRCFLILTVFLDKRLKYKSCFHPLQSEGSQFRILTSWQYRRNCQRGYHRVVTAGKYLRKKYFSLRNGN